MNANEHRKPNENFVVQTFEMKHTKTNHNRNSYHRKSLIFQSDTTFDFVIAFFLRRYACLSKIKWSESSQAFLSMYGWQMMTAKVICTKYKVCDTNVFFFRVLFLLLLLFLHLWLVNLLSHNMWNNVCSVARLCLKWATNIFIQPNLCYLRRGKCIKCFRDDIVI